MLKWFIGPIGRWVGIGIIVVLLLGGWRYKVYTDGYNSAINKIEQKTDIIVKKGINNYENNRNLTDDSLRKRLREWVPD